MDHILGSFADRADGVIVISCHEGNCQPPRGNTYAEWRLDTARVLLREVGLAQERLMFRTVASNMGGELLEAVHNAVRRLGGCPTIGIAAREVEDGPKYSRS